MKITIFKSKTLQISDYEPIKYGYGLENEVDENVHTHKEMMEKMIDEWIEEETTKVLEAKKIKENHGAIHPSLDIPF